MKRYLEQHIKTDLEKKIVLLGGPRQVGKTTLSKSLFKDFYYLNYDVVKDRKSILEQTWPRDIPLVILDEIHKLKKWKTLLKGIYDSEGVTPRLLVTGSARMDIVKKMGDSLAGRHLYWKLHPLCPKELKNHSEPAASLEKIINQSGFPEPFFAQSDFYPRWAKSHMDIILRQDLLDLERVSDILAIETLIELLSSRVGQIVSYESLAQDLNRSPITIKRWINLLENLFVIFRVTPWTKNIARSLLKAPKFYFFDCARVQGDIGAKFENAIACCLIKEIDLINDLKGANLALHYIRDKEGHELDFAVCNRQHVLKAIEAKWANDEFSPNFQYFSQRSLGSASAIQLVAQLHRTKQSASGAMMYNAAKWLADIDFSKLAERKTVKLTQSLA